MSCVDDVPVANTPSGGLVAVPPPILGGCDEPLPSGAPDLRGVWRTLEHGVHDVAEFDLTTPIHVVATYEDGVHVLRPQGLDIEVRRWRDRTHMMWQYLGFDARLERLGGPDLDPALWEETT